MVDISLTRLKAVKETSDMPIANYLFVKVPNVTQGVKTTFNIVTKKLRVTSENTKSKPEIRFKVLVSQLLK